MTSIELIGKLETEKVELSARIRNLKSEASRLRGLLYTQGMQTFALIQENVRLKQAYRADTQRFKKAIELKDDKRSAVRKAASVGLARVKPEPVKYTTEYIVAQRITGVLQHYAPLTRPAGGADDVQNVLPANQHRGGSSKPSKDKLRKSRAGWQD